MDELQTQLDSWEGSFESRLGESSSELDAATEQRLESMGYIQ